MLAVIGYGTYRVASAVFRFVRNRHYSMTVRNTYLQNYRGWLHADHPWNQHELNALAAANNGVLPNPLPVRDWCLMRCNHLSHVNDQGRIDGPRAICDCGIIGGMCVIPELVDYLRAYIVYKERTKDELLMLSNLARGWLRAHKVPEVLALLTPNAIAVAYVPHFTELNSLRLMQGSQVALMNDRHSAGAIVGSTFFGIIKRYFWGHVDYAQGCAELAEGPTLDLTSK
jgi:hypothetical protein